jgi:hypothetical protein
MQAALPSIILAVDSRGPRRDESIHQLGTLLDAAHRLY